jgi:hypothetical protein
MFRVMFLPMGSKIPFSLAQAQTHLEASALLFNKMDEYNTKNGAGRYYVAADDQTQRPQADWSRGATTTPKRKPRTTTKKNQTRKVY